MVFTFTHAVELTAPYHIDVSDGDVIDLGAIGPGQTVSLDLNPIVKTGGTFGQGGQYDRAYVSDLPANWKTVDSKLYQNPLHLSITADPDAKDGDYFATANVIDENNGENLPLIKFKVKVKITHNVLGFEISPLSQRTGPGQPARFDLTIENKGSTGDVFEISANGPKQWAFKQQIYVPSHSSKTVIYEIVGEEEEKFETTLRVVSLASDQISAEKSVSIDVRSDLIGDYKATNHGTMLFPVFESPIYALAGLISNLFR